MRPVPLPCKPRNRIPGPAMLLSVVAALLAALPAAAQGPGPGGDDDDDGEDKWSWGLGIGVANGQKAYAGMERETRAIPMIQFENRYVRLTGLGLEVKLPGLAISDSQELGFGLIGRRNMGSGYEPDDAPVLAGMSERKGGFWAGARVEWKTGVVNIAAEWTGDASGHSKGRRFSLGASRPWHLGERLVLIPRLGTTWQDRKHNDYYYGVRDEEARPGRPAYRAGAGVNIEAGLSGMYMFDRHHSAMLGVSGNSLSRQIRDSPLVDRSSESRLFMAYVYRF